MSDYSYTADFLGKDSLPTGDPDKIIQGADFDAEFEKIVTAIASKLNKTGGTLTGALTGTTATFTGAVAAASISGGTF
jgi:hypothetical protein